MPDLLLEPRVRIRNMREAENGRDADPNPVAIRRDRRPYSIGDLAPEGHVLKAAREVDGGEQSSRRKPRRADSQAADRAWRVAPCPGQI